MLATRSTLSRSSFFHQKFKQNDMHSSWTHPIPIKLDATLRHIVPTGPTRKYSGYQKVFLYTKKSIRQSSLLQVHFHTVKDCLYLNKQICWCKLMLVWKKKWPNWSNLMLITTNQNLTEAAKVVKGDIINALVPYEVMS